MPGLKSAINSFVITKKKFARKTKKVHFKKKNTYKKGMKGGRRRR